MWLQLWVADTSICTSCHPSPRHRGNSFTKQPTGAPLPEKGRNSLARPKGKHNRNRKAMATSTAGPAAFSCIIAQSFILEIKFKKHGRNLLFHSGHDCNDNQHENNCYITTGYSICTFSPKITPVARCWQWWLGRASTRPWQVPRERLTSQCNPHSEIWSVAGASDSLSQRWDHHLIQDWSPTPGSQNTSTATDQCKNTLDLCFHLLKAMK